MTDPYQQPPVNLDKGAWGEPVNRPAAPEQAPWPGGPGSTSAVPPAPVPGQWGGPPPAWPPAPAIVAWPAPPQVVPTSALASPWVRLGAVLLNGLLMVVTLFIGWLVWTMVLWGQGTNPGKKMLGLAVVKADTGRLCGWGDMCVRNFVFGTLVLGIAGSVTFCLVTLVDALMIFGERRQRLIDRMAGTLVVVVRR